MLKGDIPEPPLVAQDPNADHEADGPSKQARARRVTVVKCIDTSQANAQTLSTHHTALSC